MLKVTWGKIQFARGSSPAIFLLICGGLFALGATGTGTAFQRKIGDKDRRIEHALNRLAFGARPGDLERVRKFGLNRWIDDQLHPNRLPVSPTLAERLHALPAINLSIQEVAEQYAARGAAPEKLRKFRQGTPAEKRAILRALPDQKPLAAVGRDLMQAKIYRALYSERQLEEVLVDFWFNHFNVYLNKGPERLLVAAYERDAIRPHVLGKFGDMLVAVAKHPAMLYYLDNWQSVDPKAAEAFQTRRQRSGGKPARRARGLNENYARELMELHTLGVDGGYTQQDVLNVARAFTGWTLRDVRRGATYHFASALHDKTEKSVLGHKLAAGRGEDDGLEVLELLANHPSTARYVSARLAQRFVADTPPGALVARMADTFRKTRGDLRQVMKAMIGAPEFFSEGAYRAKMKSPFEMVVSAARALNAAVTNALALSRSLDELGQPLYRKEEPTGYYNTAAEWTNTAALLGRMNFATALAANKLPGVNVDPASFQPPSPLRASLGKWLDGRQPTPELIAGLAIGSPEFQRR